ncbi:hypothetical protein RD792_015678 [Penstemon davidsonii]|uniref:3-beta hydroxysteroid dehydrogenase/isomerase domain-containing protein n=1 Tax=Penstemon davidsonii TaxID=160366 RepID=A0ABR0CIA8_9LAMI|nr:hypothetical protein RD792_015678 [Penstemon davidsonii]
MAQNSVFAATFKVMKMFQRVRRQVETRSLPDELNTKLVKPLGTMFKSSHSMEMDKLDDDMRSGIDRLLEVTNRCKKKPFDDATRSEIDKIHEVAIRMKSLMQGNVLEKGAIKSESDKLVELMNRLKSLRKGSKKDISYLTNLPGASERLHIFNADLEKPDSFDAAIAGCIAVFHVAHPIDFGNKETEEMITEKSVKGMLGILKACVDSKTVKRVVYTSSASTVMFSNERKVDVLDESLWSDVDYIRDVNLFGGSSYYISKTITERAAIEFAEKNSLDLVTVLPTWIHGPFICSGLPGSVSSSLSTIIGNEKQIRYYPNNLVHIDDVASAHIFLFEYPEAKGRYICSAVEITTDKLKEFLSERYPEFQIPSADSLTDAEVKFVSLSSKKLSDTGFKYKYGLEEMFDGAIECCKEKGLL